MRYSRTGAARVFIGHATGQTTGLGGHMAARFIPTVERESIDLMYLDISFELRMFADSPTF